MRQIKNLFFFFYLIIISIGFFTLFPTAGVVFADSTDTGVSCSEPAPGQDWGPNYCCGGSSTQMCNLINSYSCHADTGTWWQNPYTEQRYAHPNCTYGCQDNGNGTGFCKPAPVPTSTPIPQSTATPPPFSTPTPVGGPSCGTPGSQGSICTTQTCSDGTACAQGHQYCTSNGTYGACSEEVNNCATQCVGQTPTPGGPSPTAPLPTPPQGGGIQCVFTNGWNIDHTQQASPGNRVDTNGISYYNVGETPQLDVTLKENNGGCWDQVSSSGEVRQLFASTNPFSPSGSYSEVCGLNTGLTTPYTFPAGFYVENTKYDPAFPNNPWGYCPDNTSRTNCISRDTDTTRDRTTGTSGNQPTNTGGQLLPGTYCIRYNRNGHGDQSCNNPIENAFCEFTVKPPPSPSGTLSCSPTNVYLGPSGTGNATVTGTYSNVESGHQAQLCFGSSSGPSAPLMQRASSGNGSVGSANNVNFITSGFNTFYLHDAPDGNASNNCSGPVLSTCTVAGIQPTGTITCNPTQVSPGNKSSVKANYNNVAPGHTAQICQTKTDGTVGLATQENPHSGGTGPLDATANASTLNSPTDVYKYNLYDNPTAGDTVANGCQGTVLASCTVTAQPPASGGNTCAITGVGELQLSGSILPQLSISYTGNTSNTTNLWVSRKDGARVNAGDIGSTGIYPPTEKTDASGNYYYKVATCPPGTPGGCSNAIVGVPAPTDFGQYYIFCDNVDTTIPGAPFCSGNPMCSYKNNTATSVDCGSNIYSCSTSSSLPDNIAPISGSVYNYDGSVQKGITMNKDASSSICAGDQLPFGSTDNNGFYIIDDKPVEQTFCLRPDASQYTSSSPYLKPSATNSEYTALVGFNIPNYECQWPGGKHTGTCFGTSTYDQYDIRSDYGLDFHVTNPGLSISCGLTGDNSINGQVTWTANNPSGGSGNYTYTWESEPQPGGPAPLTPTPPPGSAAVWKTSYGANGPVGAKVTIKDNTLSTPPVTSPVCIGDIAVPSSLNVSGDVHSNK